MASQDAKARSWKSVRTCSAERCRQCYDPSMVQVQSTLDLRGVAQAEATTREEVTGRLQNLLDNEARAREQSCQAVSARCDEAEARLEQLTRTLVAEDAPTKQF